MTIKNMPSRGDMKFRITINQKVATPLDDRGGVSFAWVLFSTRWAFFDSWKGRKTFIDQQIVQTMYLRCVTPWDPNLIITSAMQLVYEGRVFNIAAAYDVAERHEYCEMSLTEGIAT